MRPTLPEPDDLTALLIRVDYSDDTAWREALAAATTPNPTYGFVARFTVVEDEAYDGLSVADLLDLHREGDLSEFFVADHRTMTDPERTLIVVNGSDVDERGAPFRVAPFCAWSVQNNLCLANMDFADFAGLVEHDGVLRWSGYL